jgi:hypothetical protein
MAKRKTIDVSLMLEWANEQLTRTDDYATDKFKAGIATMIEQLLFRSNNYNGYMVLEGGDFNRYYYKKTS